ncbi:MAG TPA: tetratricopeptide repeat protein [Flavobacteriaceae bacterium]|nr:tetratricopeptide repeat protein [Flavobacteriaceae bacterium]HIN98898.1 tetratricopeptide repeat protein [Flavobacteriaceae bacterium]|tara:strand:- start:28125 stop:28874 length:750 start_codon:yes stop_codon:yes gene_type:complete
MKRTIFILLVLFTATGWGQSDALFEQGKEHYKNAKYQEAINSWEKILDNGQHSASLYFNLGNANYKLNKVGPSIFFYEKALQLAPNDSDIKTNLKFAENARIDAIEPLPKTVFSKWYNAVAGLLHFDGWAILAVAGTILFVVFFLTYWFTVGETKKRVFFSTSILILLVMLGSVAMAFQTYGDYQSDRPAIVFAESSEARAEPNMGGEVAFVLHEGTKVQILAEEASWIRIRLANGKDGWIPQNDVKQL